MIMEINLVAIGTKDKNTAKAFINLMMGINMKENG